MRTAKAKIVRSRLKQLVATSALALLAHSSPAQPGATTARDSATFDPTGYWVSVVSEEWRWRMLTPPKGDYASIPLNAEGRRIADSWDRAADTASDRCRQYGAAGLMRIPGRLHIQWEDDETLRIEFDAGMQTRYLHFDPAASGREQRSLQGNSRARWHKQPQARGLAFGPPDTSGSGGTLIVVTDNTTGGYLRANGVPYSENTLMTEYFNRHEHRTGESWLVVTSVIEDPMYLSQPFVVSTHFRRERDGDNWMPRPCRDSR
jgi:hypothetical protein